MMPVLLQREAKVDSSSSLCNDVIRSLTISCVWQLTCDEMVALSAVLEQVGKWGGISIQLLISK